MVNWEIAEKADWLFLTEAQQALCSVYVFEDETICWGSNRFIWGCEFGDTLDDQILEHLIQTIENQQLIQRCISKGWELAQFLLEAGQTEDIALQVQDMKEPQDR